VQLDIYNFITGTPNTIFENSSILLLCFPLNVADFIPLGSGSALKMRIYVHWLPGQYAGSGSETLVLLLFCPLHCGKAEVRLGMSFIFRIFLPFILQCGWILGSPATNIQLSGDELLLPGPLAQA
jgi:hypothetical protein